MNEVVHNTTENLDTTHTTPYDLKSVVSRTENRARLVRSRPPDGSSNLIKV